MRKLFLSAVGILACVSLVRADSLYLNEGTQTISSAGNFEHIVVSNGTLNVTGAGTVVTAADVSVGIGTASLATLNVTEGAKLVVTGEWLRAANYHPMNVGHGGTGVVNVVNAELTAHDVILCNLQSPFTKGGVGSLNVSNSTVTVQSYLHNTRGNNSSLTEPLSIITLHQGGMLNVGFYVKNANPWAAIRFDGGRMAYSKLNPMDGSRLILEGLNGNPIDLQQWAPSTGNMYLFQLDSSANGACEVYLRGTGGLRKRGTSSGYVAQLNGTQAAKSFVRSEFSGTVRMDGGILYQTAANQLGNAAATLDFSETPNARLDMRGFDMTFGSVVGHGLVNSGTESAKLVLGGDNSNSELVESVGRVSLIKEGAGTLTVRGTPLADLTVEGGRVIIADGAWPAYSRYKIEFTAVAGSASQYVGMSEIGFYHADGERDLNAVASERNPSSVFDDNWEVLESSSNCYLVQIKGWPITATITHGLARAIAGYRICTGYDYGCRTHHEGRESIKGADYAINANLCRDPSAWNVYGSNDGTSWTLLDTQSAQVLPNRRYTWSEEYALPKLRLITGAVDVKAGASLKVACTDVFAPSAVVNNGTIAFDDGTSYGAVSADGETVTNNVFASVVGAPAFLKTGDGVSVYPDGSTYSGSVTVSNGVMAFTKATGYSQKYWRWRIRNLKAWKDGAAFTPNSIEMQEFGLFDRNGTRVNLASGGTKLISGLGQAANLLNGDVGRGMFQFIEATGIPEGAVPIKRPYDEDESTWATAIVLKLPDSAPAVFGYQFATGYDHTDRDPNSWDISVSDNGTDWTIVDVQTKVEIGEARKSWTAFNQGHLFEVAGAGSDYAVYTPDTVVGISAGARLELPGTTTQTGVVVVDCTAGGGTLSNFNPAPNGEIRLVNVPNVQGRYEVPLTIEHVVNALNLRSWTVFVNGEDVSSRVKLVWSDGHLALVSAGTIVIFR